MAPVTYSSSPGFAPERVSTCRRLAVPATVSIEHQRPIRSGEVTADDRHAVFDGQGDQAGDHLFEVGDRECMRKRQRQQRQPRCRAHRREIAQVDRQGPVPDG